MFKIRIKSLMVISIVVLISIIAVGGCGKKEHPEHPDGAAAQPTKDQLADAVEGCIADKSADTQGLFVVVDPKTGETLELVLDKVHREKLCKLEGNQYFACADFTTNDGTVYDLDVFMEGKDADSLEFSEFTVHKEDGIERYAWAEDDGIWIKQDIDD
jgi:hypothetical protein